MQWNDSETSLSESSFKFYPSFTIKLYNQNHYNVIILDLIWFDGVKNQNLLVQVKIIASKNMADCQKICIPNTMSKLQKWLGGFHYGGLRLKWKYGEISEKPPNLTHQN